MMLVLKLILQCMTKERKIEKNVMSQDISLPFTPAVSSTLPYRFNLPLSTVEEHCGLMHDVLGLGKNIMVMRNFHGGVRGSKGRLYTPTHTLPNIDVWLLGSLQMVTGVAGVVTPKLVDIFQGLATRHAAPGLWSIFRQLILHFLPT